jgi:alkanesulfonate monooxygenase SsuD/methylene tetrahydromethanopterin reductase-like flavin-dependent oxidoreductase (luciferase family)
VPVIFGGVSAPALRRVADYGDGWYGFNLDPESAAAKIKTLERFLADNGRGLGDVELIVAPYTKRIAPDDLARYRDLGVSEVVLLASLPPSPAEAVSRIERFAREWIEPAARR